MTSRRVTMVLVLGTVVALMLALAGAASAQTGPNPTDPPGDGGGGNPDPTPPPGGGTGGGNAPPPGGGNGGGDGNGGGGGNGGGNGGGKGGGGGNGGGGGGNDGFTLVTQQSSSGGDFDVDFDVVEEVAEDGDFFLSAPLLFFLFADDLCSPLNPDAINELCPAASSRSRTAAGAVGPVMREGDGAGPATRAVLFDAIASFERRGGK